MHQRYITAVLLLLGPRRTCARWCATLLLLVLVLLAGGPADATTYYASPSGGSGCSTNPNAGGDLVYAANNCWRNPGDILYLRGGTYDTLLHGFNNIVWPTGSNFGTGAMTMASYPGETARIRYTGSGEGNMVVITGPLYREFLIFDRIIFDGSQLDTPGQVMKLDEGSRNLRVQNCVVIGNSQSNGISGGAPENFAGGAHSGTQLLGNEVRDNGGYGMYIGGWTQDWLVDGNDIHHNVGYAIHLYFDRVCGVSGGTTIRNNRMHHNVQFSGGAVDNAQVAVACGDNYKFYNNLIYNNGGAYTGVTPTHAGAGISLKHATNSLVAFNTIVANDFFKSCILTENTGGGHTIRNNLCYNNGTDGVADESTGGGSTVNTNWFTSDGNPQFVNLGANDFHLTAGSSNTLRNGGAAGTGVTTDFDGNPRDSTPSLGAFEFGTGFSPVIGTFYIATNGTDAVDCAAAQSISTPRATLANVLPCAAGGSTIWYRSGTYTNTQGLDTNVQPLVGGTSPTNLTRIGTLPSDRAGGLAVLRSTTGNVLWFFRGNATDQFITIESLILDSTSVTSSNVLAFYPGAHDITLSGVTARNAHFEPVFIFGASGITLSGVTVTGSTVTCAVGIYNASSTITIIASALESTAGGGVCSSGGLSGLRVERSVLRSMSGPAISVADASAPFIVNNLIYSNPSGITLSGSTTNAEVYNNTIWNNTTGAGLTVAAGVTSTVRNNILFANGSAISGTPSTASNNVTTNPSFVSPGPPSTFHVQGTNVVGQGFTVASVSTDFNGTGRTIPYTIGAYEDETAATIPIVSLTATPTTITVGNSSTLNWSSSNATSCSAPWTGSTATSGSQSVSPTITTTYTVTCTDGTTPVGANATVTVTGTPSVSLTATPSTINTGQSSTLSWTSSNVTSCSAPWTGSTATAGSQSVSPTITTTYTITCTDGTTPVTSNATVTVGTPSALPVRVPAYGTTGALLP
jgi:parallel beta-helix repeat protein